jgi:hypothetical protein
MNEESKEMKRRMPLTMILRSNVGRRSTESQLSNVNFDFVQVSFSNPQLQVSQEPFFFRFCSVELAAFQAKLLVDVDGGETTCERKPAQVTV